MAKHKWTYPGEWQTYLNSLENPKYPSFELIQELDVGNTCFAGSGRAWVVRDTENGIVCLQSYATIVSVQSGSESVDLGKWSRTTSHHQRHFSVWCSHHR